MRTITQTRNNRFSLFTTTTLLALLCATAFAQQKGTFKDTRDGKTYKTVKIGEQVWMAENLNYNLEGSMCYGDKAANCTKYGRLYLNDQAGLSKLAKSACPAGWHLPSDNEWTTLTDFVGGKDIAVKKLKAKSGWNKNSEGKSGNGTDNYGFSALPGGYSGLGARGLFFEGAGDLSYWFGDYGMNSDDGVTDYNRRNYSNSIRCIQDDANYSAAKAKAEAEAKTKLEAIRKANGGEFTDTRDKKTYLTIKIGKQTWMAENLNYNAKGSKCYDNKPANCEKYGRLYTAEQANNACPNGWYFPSDKDWTTLTDFAGGYKVAGNKLKTTSGWDWNEGTDDYGFSALPGGAYLNSFSSVGLESRWWHTTEDGTGIPYYYFSSMDYGGDVHWSVISGNSGGYKEHLGYYYSVRCVQEDANYYAEKKAKEEAEAKAKAKLEAIRKTNGGEFTDTRDKKTYQTIKIGKQIWMAENLNYNAKGSKCYDNKPANCEKYGRFYDWATAMAFPSNCNYNSCREKIQAKHQGVCPSGWHIPGSVEWYMLREYIEKENNCKSCADNYLKAAIGWKISSGIENLDTYGFSALPGGTGNTDGDFNAAGQYGFWIRPDASCEAMYYNNNNRVGDCAFYKSYNSVRCIKDEEVAAPTPQPSQKPANQPAPQPQPNQKPANQPSSQPSQQKGNENCSMTFPKKACVAMPAGTCKMTGGKVVDKCP